MDLDAIDFPTFGAARADAISAAGEMLKDLKGSFPLGAKWQMDVTDEAGRPVLTLRFIAEEHSP